MILRTLAGICVAVLLTAFEVGCGGGTEIAPPALSLSTTTLRDGMATFPYSQTIAANGGVALLYEASPPEPFLKASCLEAVPPTPLHFPARPIPLKEWHFRSK